uniref:CRAL-TRIO domain-containing protein n=2 Tax=Clastoptera arizonana TaxID=38151 RepID=A0A1B6C3A9_9HEMI
MIDDFNPFKISLEEELQRNPQLKVDDIKNLQVWLKDQPSFPKMYDEQLCQFAHACYYDVEETKKTLQYFFKYKASMTEFFSGWDPNSPELHSYVDSVLYAAVLPRHSLDEQQILVLKLKDTVPENYDFATSVKWLIMTVSRLQMEQGTQPGFILVYDGTGYTFSHVLRNPLSLVKNYIQFGENASSIRVTEIHFINSSSIVKKMINLLKPLLDKDLMKMMTIHTSAEAFFKNIPPTRVPEDYGGTAQTMAELHKENVDQMKKARLEMLGQEKLCGNDIKKEATKKKSEKKIETSFRHLELD